MPPRFWRAIALGTLLWFSPSPVAVAATFSVTVNTNGVLTAPFLPAARSGTGLTNGPAWMDSSTVLGITTLTENFELLTPDAAVNLDWLTGRTKGITLNQPTTFNFINTPTVSTNLQRMYVQVVGDGGSTVTFTGAVWQTAQIVTPPPLTITVYTLETTGGIVNGYAGSTGGGGTATQVIFSGHYGGGLPNDVPSVASAIAYDLDLPHTQFQWDGSAWY